MPQFQTISTEKANRIRETASQFARQTGGTFVEVREKRADFETRERAMATNPARV